MKGSAVIGTLLAPILEATDPPAAREDARQLGLVFQLTNFLREVAEDYQRGRMYLPAEDLERFGVRRQDLAAPTASPAVRKLLAFEVARTREHYRAAEPGIGLLAASSRPCVRDAFDLYGASWMRLSGPATRSWTAAWPSPATAASGWPAVTGPPPRPPPAPSARSPSPPPAAGLAAAHRSNEPRRSISRRRLTQSFGVS
jgi:hypothetical protein